MQITDRDVSERNEESQDRYDYQHEADTFLPQDETLAIGEDALADVVDECQPSERTGNAARQACKRPAKRRMSKNETTIGSLDERIESAQAAQAHRSVPPGHQKDRRQEH